MMTLPIPTFGLLPSNTALTALNVSDPTNCPFIKAKSAAVRS